MPPTTCELLTPSPSRLAGQDLHQSQTLVGTVLPEEKGNQFHDLLPCLWRGNRDGDRLYDIMKKKIMKILNNAHLKWEMLPLVLREKD